VDGDGFLTKNDFSMIAENIINVGHFTGFRADEIRIKYMKLWTKYFKPAGGEVATCEEMLSNLKSHGKTDLGTTAIDQFSQIFDAVDTSNDGVIQIQEFISYFNAMGISEVFAREAFKELDTNHDGVLSREEFITAARDFVILEDPSFPSDLFFGSLI